MPVGEETLARQRELGRVRNVPDAPAHHAEGLGEGEDVEDMGSLQHMDHEHIGSLQHMGELAEAAVPNNHAQRAEGHTRALQSKRLQTATAHFARTNFNARARGTTHRA